MSDGAELAAMLRKDRSGGIPWLVILDADGKEIVSSDGPQGNIGCPVQPHECTWFMEMIKRSRTNLSEVEFLRLTGLLEIHAIKYRRK